MLTINTYIAQGGGTLPKDLDLDSIILLDASSNEGTAFEWEMISKPELSNAVIQSPITAITKIGPLNIAGVYQVRLWVNRNAYGQGSKTITFNVPDEISPLPAPDDPLFDSGGRIRNFSFELPGPLAGWAAWWNISDAGNVLSGSQAGVSRGRCIPTDFTPPSGDYAMVLGDDISGSADVPVGDEFSVSQEVDFTNMNILELQLKYKGNL